MDFKLSPDQEAIPGINPPRRWSEIEPVTRAHQANHCLSRTATDSGPSLSMGITAPRIPESDGVAA